MEVIEVKLNIALLVTFLALTSMFGFFVYKERNAAKDTLEKTNAAKDTLEKTKEGLKNLLKGSNDVISPLRTKVCNIFDKISKAANLEELQEIIYVDGYNSKMYASDMQVVFQELGTTEDEIKSRIDEKRVEADEATSSVTLDNKKSQKFNV